MSKPIPPFLAPAFDHVADESSQHFDSSHFASARVCVCECARVGGRWERARNLLQALTSAQLLVRGVRGSPELGERISVGIRSLFGAGEGGRGDGELGGAGTVFLGDG